jgi:hypothetical protein
MAKKKTSPKPSKPVEALFSGKKLTAAQRKEVRELGESMIDGFMKAVGFEDVEERTDENGWRHLRLESVEGVAGIKESDGELYLHVEALIMALPSDKDLIQALMREALELNCTLPGACSLGIRGTWLVASATENLRTLDSSSAYGSLIHLVMALANTIDDGLKERFGGTSRTRRKASKEALSVS